MPELLEQRFIVLITAIIGEKKDLLHGSVIIDGKH